MSIRPVAATIAFGLILAACGDSDSDRTPAASAGVSSTSSPSTSSTAASAPSAACTADALLGPVQAALDRPDDPAGGQTGLRVVSVDVLDCRNGYARVSAHADVPNLEAAQVFLRDVGGDWQYLEAGTGIECGDSSLTAAVQEACAALSRDG
jgi:hypothetical protein